MSDPQPSNYPSDPSWQAPSPAGYPDPPQTPTYQQFEQPGQATEPVSPVTYPTSGDPATAVMPPGAVHYPVPGYPAPPGYPVPGYPFVAAPATNGMAIAALVVSIVGMLGICAYGLGGYLGIVGAILGHVSRKQIRERGEGGDGLAMAGLIVGWIAGGIAVLATIGFIILGIVVANQDSGSNY
ncbi:DUF4190 domain-containing protein [Plantactinospora sonchi]|uniref:DUF4190 domain-containing protein n=1 Tax=Plantactinospora sonchi TaxID=1544735 RepID=A0ABU7RSH2_9ACTN